MARPAPASVMENRRSFQLAMKAGFRSAWAATSASTHGEPKWRLRTADAGCRCSDSATSGNAHPPFDRRGRPPGLQDRRRRRPDTRHLRGRAVRPLSRAALFAPALTAPSFFGRVTGCPAPAAATPHERRRLPFERTTREARGLFPAPRGARGFRTARFGGQTIPTSRGPGRPPTSPTPSDRMAVIASSAHPFLPRCGRVPAQRRSAHADVVDQDFGEESPTAPDALARRSFDPSRTVAHIAR